MTEPTAYELRNGIRRGDWSARELVQQSLDRVDRLDPRTLALESTEQHPPQLGALVEVRAELALKEADAADRLLAGTPAYERAELPPLLGLPTAHKDRCAVSPRHTARQPCLT